MNEIAIELESLSQCPLCGLASMEPAPQQPASPYGLMQCADCNIIFVSPRPSAGSIPAVYDAYYTNRFVEPTSKLQARAQRHVRRVLKYVPGPARILEVGAGDGYFLHELHRIGWTVEGVELAEPRVRRAREWFNLTLHNCDLISAPLEKGIFDVITMFQVIEHTNNPLAILRRANDLLKPGGLLLLSTPNVLSYPRRGRKVPRWNIPLHLFFFTPNTLVRAAEAAGFTVVRKTLKFQAKMERRFKWQPWPGSGSIIGRAAQTLITPFGLNLVARKT